MILTVTPNAALDISYHVDELVVHQSHRVTAVHQRAGGKGVNVASVLARMGHPVIATGLVGGAAGEEIRADLEARGVTAQFVVVGGSSRRTVNVVSAAHGDATVFNEPGPELAGPDWQSLVAGIDSLLADAAATVVVLSGSLPPGPAGRPGCRPRCPATPPAQVMRWPRRWPRDWRAARRGRGWCGSGRACRACCTSTMRSASRWWTRLSRSGSPR